jgi:phospholipase C
VPPSIRKALAVPANNRTRSIRDVEHVVFLMQENRSFDHYFGTLRGVRGFADPHPIRLPSGASVAPVLQRRRAAAVPAGRGDDGADVPAGPATRLARRASGVEWRPS